MKTTYSASNVDHPTLVAFINYISDQPNISKNIAACSQHIAVCPRQLRRLCKKHLAVSPYEVLKVILINHAKMRLMDKQQSIKAIALDLGFTEHSNFSNFFRKTVGLYPKMYRLRYNNSKLSDLHNFLSE